MLGATTDLPPTLTGGGRNKIAPFLYTGMKLSVSGTNLIVWLPVSTKLLTGQRVWQVGKTMQAIQPVKIKYLISCKEGTPKILWDKDSGKSWTSILPLECFPTKSKPLTNFSTFYPFLDFWEEVQDFDQLIISATYCPEPEQLETDEIKFSGTGSAGSLKYTGKRISKMKKSLRIRQQTCFFNHPTNLWKSKIKKTSFYLLGSEKM